MPTERKQDVLDKISGLLGTPRRVVGPGSKEPKQILLDVVNTFALRLDTSASKPALAQAIVETTGGSWTDDCDSRKTESHGGSTITTTGLKAVLKAVRRLHTEAGAQLPPGEPAAGPLGTSYREANQEQHTKASDPFRVDPDAVDRANTAHARTQNEISQWADGHGLVPLSPEPGDPQFDAGWMFDETFFVVEVKSLVGRREDGQMRLGIGQVLDYRRLIQMQTGQPCMAVLAVSRQPRGERWSSLCEELGIRLVWPGTFDALPH